MQLPVAFRPIFQNFYSAMEKFYDRARIQATTSQLGSRLPKQIQRALPVYVACILLVLFLANIDSFGSQDSGTDVFKRDLSRRSTLTGHEFPRKIWQTWKVNPLGFEEKNLNVARTWTEKNPGHRYEVLTDSNDMYYVETHFGPAGLNRPDIVYMYRNLTAKIIKADLLRYLIMYIEGGLYTDIDVEALRPIERFIPDRYNEKDIDMVIGVEIDQPDYIDHPILGPKSQSFCQWTFMCKPRLPVMMRLVENILKWLNEVAQKQNVPVSEIVLDFDEVISGTGPSAFTTAVLAEMTARHGETVDWDYFHDIVESKLVGGVLVLTVEAFAAGQGHSDSGNHNARNALVKHHYHASGWPTNHPRYNHPVYGEVEKCNWNVECVRLWDEHKAAFEALSPEEQAKQIAEKEAADKAEAAEKEAKEAAEKAAKEAEEKEKEAKEAAKEAAWEAAKKAANPLDFTLWDTNKAALEAQAVLETLPPDEQAKQIAEKDAAAAKLALLALPDEQAKQMAEKDAAAAKLALLAPPDELAKQKAEKEKEVAAPPLALGPPSP